MITVYLVSLPPIKSSTLPSSPRYTDLCDLAITMRYGKASKEECGGSKSCAFVLVQINPKYSEEGIGHKIQGDKVQIKCYLSSNKVNIITSSCLSASREKQTCSGLTGPSAEIEFDVGAEGPFGANFTVGWTSDLNKEEGMMTCEVTKPKEPFKVAKASIDFINIS
ncbi:uncharacterized protein LOC135143481 isoform X2 [Zophobas morio]